MGRQPIKDGQPGLNVPGTLWTGRTVCLGIISPEGKGVWYSHTNSCVTWTGSGPLLGHISSLELLPWRSRGRMTLAARESPQAIEGLAASSTVARPKGMWGGHWQLCYSPNPEDPEVQEISDLPRDTRLSGVMGWIMSPPLPPHFIWWFPAPVCPPSPHHPNTTECDLIWK